MTQELPEKFDTAQEIEIDWSQGPDGTKVTITLADAKVTVETNGEDPHESVLPWLIAALPQILDTAFEAIEEQEGSTEEEVEQ